MEASLLVRLGGIAAMAGSVAYANLGHRAPLANPSTYRISGWVLPSPRRPIRTATQRSTETKAAFRTTEFIVYMVAAEIGAPVHLDLPG